MQPGSVLLWVEGHDVRGQGTDGVQRAIGLCRSAHTVEFVFRKPAVHPAAHLQPVLVPFDCTFEERDPLGLEFDRSLARAREVWRSWWFRTLRQAPRPRSSFRTCARRCSSRR